MDSRELWGLLPQMAEHSDEAYGTDNFLEVINTKSFDELINGWTDYKLGHPQYNLRDIVRTNEGVMMIAAFSDKDYQYRALVIAPEEITTLMPGEYINLNDDEITEKIASI